MVWAGMKVPPAESKTIACEPMLVQDAVSVMFRVTGWLKSYGRPSSSHPANR